MNNYPSCGEDQPRKHEKVPCAGDPGQEQDAGEDEDDVESKQGGEEHLAEELHFRNLVIVDVVAPDPLAGDKLRDVVAVVVEEDGHRGEQGGADDDPHRAEDEGARPR